MKQESVLIQKDMNIGEVVQKYPQAVEVFLRYGLHCIGCHVSPHESIEQGAMGHGMPEEVMKEMIEEANEAAKHAPQKPATGKEGNVTLTDAAIDKIKELQKKEGRETSFFRIGVMPGGCSGFSYHFDFEETAQEHDQKSEQKGLKILIDEAAMDMLAGAHIDYVETIHGAGFKIDNPNAKKSCGCGNSFG